MARGEKALANLRLVFADLPRLRDPDDAYRLGLAETLYDAILPALGAPKWHGRGINALVESMIWGAINDVEPPL